MTDFDCYKYSFDYTDIFLNNVDKFILNEISNIKITGHKMTVTRDVHNVPVGQITIEFTTKNHFFKPPKE